MKAIVLRGPNDFCLEEVKEPIPTAEEVKIRVLLAGICGTDLTLLRGKYPAAPYPMVPGHETMGEILQAAEDSQFKPGDRVTVFPAFGCRKCDACKTGRIAHCPEAKTIGVLRPEGYFAEQIVAHQDRVFHLPEQMHNEMGAMVEPAAVAVHANHRGQVQQGARVVVIGGGTIGLLTAQVALAYGASAVIVSEPIAERRAIAKQVGIELTCNPLETDLVCFVRKKMKMADVVFDVVGSEKTLADAMEMLRPDGHLVLVAVPHSDTLSIAYRPAFTKELKVIGARTYFLEDFPESIRLLHSGRVQVKQMVGKILPLSLLAEGVELLEKHPEDYVKILLNPLM
ncbi:MAG: alcohol dehydrogenase catalytic domain-containing protein [Deltaproteobacteria bacterium]|nr:alcohol dehydrogenase catalytic domain-containing protein [Deltaproteobacteria bacterium]MBW1960965.1 alcohol dehydrogenase catalytic domain-containing protein [Deltaproteobacteria bacterium]MBW1994133.1 alcohol dehydrogenase catalytic domain-containing protein [Deltaproteobacteria bacterium]MBW2152380.1 alcohol dehydrogenase catalytic domain-containing protein [Deltaproteobacteria bacterium]